MSLVSGNVLVTGATGGIGHAIARAFAARGAKLLLTGRRVSVLEALAAETSGRAIPCDLADRADVEHLGVEANEAAIDVLIANAALPGSRYCGIEAHQALEGTDTDQVQAASRRGQ